LRNASLPRENSVCRALSMRSKSCHAGGVHCGGHADGARRATRHAYNATWPAAQTARCDARDGDGRVRYAMQIATTLRQPHNCRAPTNEDTNKQPIKVAAKQTHTQTHTQTQAHKHTHKPTHTHTHRSKEANKQTYRTARHAHIAAPMQRCAMRPRLALAVGRDGAARDGYVTTCGVGCQYSVSLAAHGTCASVPGGPGGRLGRLL
jgi:hypothetical protein